VLYVSDSSAGACAEAFNRGKYRTQWTRDILRSLPGNPKLLRSLAWFEIDDKAPISNLDDPHELVSRQLRPSGVIARDYSRTQAWALNIFSSATVAGIRWWSYHDARWANLGLWDLSVITDFGVNPLGIDDPAMQDAADVLSIRIV
jgi:RES domain